MSSPEHKQLIWNLIKEIKVGMLVTTENENDTLRARPMHLVQEEYDNTLYFFTSKKDSKVFEIEKNKEVNLSFSDTKESIYVSLSGNAELSDDSKLIDRYWNSWVATWFDKGKDDPDIGMLKVKISKGEHWDANENKLVQAFKVAKAYMLESEAPEIGENEKFG